MSVLREFLGGLLLGGLIIAVIGVPVLYLLQVWLVDHLED